MSLPSFYLFKRRSGKVDPSHDSQLAHGRCFSGAPNAFRDLQPSRVIYKVGYLGFRGMLIAMMNSELDGDRRTSGGNSQFENRTLAAFVLAGFTLI